MAYIGSVVVIICTCMSTICGQGTLTIQDIIRGRPELSRLNDFMRATDIFSALGQTNVRFTLFAPNNGAMDGFQPANSGRLGKETKEELLNYHIVLANMDQNRPPITLNNMRNSRVETNARNAPKIFLRTYVVGQQTHYYVNGAQVVDGDVQAQNGVVHIIESVLSPIALKENALALIEDSQQQTNSDRNAKVFFDLLNTVRYQDGSPYRKLNSDDAFVTVFVPTDKSLEKVLTGKRKETLKQDKEAIVDLLRRHVIVHSVSEGTSNEGVTAVWHATLLNHAIDGSLLTGSTASIPAMEGEIRPVRIGNTLYVTNVCGMVKVKDLPEPILDEDAEDNDHDSFQSTKPHYASEYSVTPDLTVNNGVVHFVDGLLGYIYNDAVTMIEEDDALSKFNDNIQMSRSYEDRLTVEDGKIVPERQKITVFAPIDGAFTNLETAGNIDFSQDQELRENMLAMHMMEGVLNLIDIGNNTRKKTLRTDKDIYANFYSDRTGTYVEVDRVRARIVKADVCVTNGIMHYIDNILGMPFRNSLDEIKELDMLNDLYEAIEKTPDFVNGNRDGYMSLARILENDDESRTIFAPNTEAFRDMRTTRIGRKYMENSNQFKLYLLLLRHMPLTTFYIEDDISGKQAVPGASGYSVFKDGEDYMVEYSGPHGSAQAKVLQRNIRLTNSVMHIISAVLFEDSQLAFESVSSAVHLTPTFALLATLYILKYIL